MDVKHAERLLAAVIICRSTALLFSKIALNEMGVFNLLAVRFLLAFALLAVLFHRRLLAGDWRTAGKGAILGLAFFMVMTCELNALKTVSTSEAAFLENTAIVLVPIFMAIYLRRLPKAPVVASSALALAGVGFITLGSGLEISRGQLICLLAASFYAMAIILTDRFSKSGDPLVIGIYQIGTLGLLALVASFLFETPSLPQSFLAWRSVIVLACICTGFGFTLQPVAQRALTAEKAGLFCALTPASASLIGMIVLGERFRPIAILGFVCILAALFLPRLHLADSLPWQPGHLRRFRHVPFLFLK